MKILILVSVASILISLNIGTLAKAELLFHYSFETGELEDVSGKGNVAEIRGEAKQVGGRVGKALEFDGKDDYIFTAGEGSGPLMFMHDPFSERSLAMWIKADDVSLDQTVIDEGGTTNGLCVKIIEGQLQFSTTNGSTAATVTADYKNTDWHHIAAVYKDGELRLYIDGSEAGADNASYQQVPSHGNDGAIGASFDGDASGGGSNGVGAWNLFTGIMDEIYFYDSAITEEEIKGLFQLGAAVEPGGKLAHTWGKIRSARS